jgi:hypothetical protein
MFSLLSMPTAEGGTDRPNIEEHFLWAVLCGTFNRNKAVFRIPVRPVAISVRNEAAAANFLGYPKRNLERFRNQRVSQALAREMFVNAQSSQQDQREIIRGQAANVLFGQAIAGYARSCQRKVAKDSVRRGFIDSYIGYADGTLLLVRPGMALEVIV